MKFKVFCTLLIGLFLIIPVMLFARNDLVAKISYIEGIVNLNLKPAEINMTVLEKDELSTKRGRVEVYLNGNYLRLNHHAQVVFDVLQEESIQIDVRYGEVYLETEIPVEVVTPHEKFSVEGLYRIEVDRYDTRKYSNLRLIDDFDKWTNRRQNELARPLADRGPSYYDWYSFSSYWMWYPHFYYTGWYSWYPYYRTGWYFNWYFGWPLWYGYYGYNYGYYPYRYDYRYDDPYYRSARTTIRKDQLQRRVSKSAGVGTRPLRKSTAATQNKISQFSKASPSVKSLRSPGKIYPSRIRDSNLSPSSRSSSRVLSRSPSRSYSGSSFSRSYSSSPRSFSNSRSFSAPSRSFSAPSRSFGSTSSRGSSGSSRGSIRRK